nr:cytochrome c oxidase assembly protein subunit 15 [Cryptococcus depauperatus CBS 7841]
MFVAALRYTTRRLGVQPVGPHRVLSTASFAMRPSVGPTRLPYFTPCTTFFYPSHSFTLPRTLSTSSSNQAAYSDIPKSLPVWLYGCSAVVFGIVVVGGLTRLTESGLSIVEWNPITGVVPPMTDAAWDAEWEKYRVSPEGILMNANISREEFKKIFYMEWAHRLAGRALGVGFVVPTLYYLLRYKLPRPLPTKLFFIGLGIGFQGVLGWWMVKSGLDERILKDGSVPRVSQYRLAAHYSAAVALYLGMLSTAIGIQRDRTLVENASSVRQLNHPAVKRFRGLVHLSGMLVALTAVTGAFVAGLDAGLVYNEFPFMGDGIVPPKDELFDDRYARTGTDKWWRNLLENPATTTFAVLSTLPFAARNLPIKAARRLAAVTTAAAVVQVSLGISTLLYLVPIPLAAMHQAGSVVLLTCIMALGGSLRKPSKMIRYLRRL